MVVEVKELGAVTGSGVVDEDVHATEFVGEFVDGRSRPWDISGVQLLHNGFAAQSADLFSRGLRTLLVPVPRDANVHAGLGQRDRRGPSDT